MTGRMPRVSGKSVLAALRRDGWSVVDIDGSHHQLEHPDHPGRVTVPVHGNSILNLKTLRSILRQANMTTDNLRALL